MYMLPSNIRRSAGSTVAKFTGQHREDVEAGTMLQFIRFMGMRFIMAIATLLIVTFIVFGLMELSSVHRALLAIHYIGQALRHSLGELGDGRFCARRLWLFLHIHISSAR
jgi:hypothetical protein